MDELEKDTTFKDRTKLKNLLQGLLMPGPEMRVSCETALEHEWLTGMLNVVDDKGLSNSS